MNENKTDKVLIPCKWFFEEVIYNKIEKIYNETNPTFTKNWIKSNTGWTYQEIKNCYLTALSES